MQRKTSYILAVLAVAALSLTTLGIGAQVAESQESERPLRTNHFTVQIGTTSASFAEVTGLGCETEVRPYREGGDVDTTVEPEPGVTTCGPVHLKRGLTTNLDLWEWYASTKNGDVDRRDGIISILGPDHEPRVVFKLVDAWPSAYEVGPLDARGSISIEELTLVIDDLERQ